MRALAFFDQNQKVQGQLLFEQTCGCQPVLVKMSLTGPAGQTHAIHVHEWGDLSNGCDSLGSHYNPDGTTHGSIFVPDRPRHAGDLTNNVTFDKNGRFEFSYWDDMLTLYGLNTIYGRSVVIHALPDDLGLGTGKARAESLKTGNAGKRIACTVIAKISD